ncbi:MAG: FAD/NAD(P)-binding oxidoreductase [Microbacterium sp.]|uniref:NAD(P)/FAD-dependent oxidoreductase n=1 Tax=Microbacterium sp. TaxID=51671 RepID=UPI00271E45F4|nr:FAD/NAD(P)-binding oxidoreductase [Microbacterium sp.]MDO8383872.1 FAD/NAD(P)-binding oxidoreductase [Microbacterium sp.]
MTTIVIAGGSIGGTTTASTLRTLGFEGNIIVLDAEPYAYPRPSLSKVAMRGEHVLEPDGDEGIEMRRSTRVVAHDPERSRVTLIGGEQVAYDQLVIATGSAARRLAPQLPGEHVVRRLDDVIALRQRLSTTRSALIIGGGLLGVEMSSACRDLGLDVTLVANRPPLQRAFGDHVATWIREEAERAGVRIVDTVGPVIPFGDPVIGVELLDGRRFEADVVITAIGDVPDVGWTPLGTSIGVLTDTEGWALPNVVVVGDARATKLGDSVVRDPHWQAAIDGGRAAAHNLLGIDPPVARARYVWTECFGHVVKLAGHAVRGGPDRLLEGDPSGARVIAWGESSPYECVISIDRRTPIPRLRSLAAVTSPNDRSLEHEGINK